MCYLTVWMVASLLVMLTTGLLYCLDYEPLATLHYHDGYCRDVATSVHLKDKIYYYTTTVYDSLKEKEIGVANGCVGTWLNSYGASAGMVDIYGTKAYPYAGYLGNVPAWLCAYAPDYSAFWDPVDHDDATTPWGDQDWLPCKYASLKEARKWPWNVRGVVQVHQNKWTAVVADDWTTFTELGRTDHYYTTIAFFYIACLVFLKAVGHMVYLHVVFNRQP
jgi:hypothetical protein